MNRKVLGIVGVALILVMPFLVRGCNRKDAQPVSTASADMRPIRTSILASGNLEYRVQAVLSPEVLSKVSKIDVKEGDDIQEGQVVMSLDAKGIEAEIEQYSAAVRQQQIATVRERDELRLQQTQLNRYEQLHTARLIEDSRLDEVRNQVVIATAELNSAKQGFLQANAILSQANDRLSKTIIRSPLSGTVTSLKIKVGETAVPSSMGIVGSNLMTVADTRTIMAKINVDEADIGRVQIGQDVSIFAASAVDVRLSGKVTSIPLSPRDLSAGSRTALQAKAYAVEVELSDIPASVRLRPGMTCRAEVYVSGTEKVLAVPQQAVFEEGNTEDSRSESEDRPEQHFLFVYKEGKAVRRAVTPGISDDTYQEIKSGIKKGDSIIVGPYKAVRDLSDGDKVVLETAGSTEK